LQLIRIFSLAAAALMAWTGLGCLFGVIRFRYFPLIILGTGYLSWVVCLVLLYEASGGNELGQRNFSLTTIFLLLGAVCIFGYRFTFYQRMKTRGITPKRLFGFGSR
jgi:hypothetical protein